MNFAAWARGLRKAAEGLDGAAERLAKRRWWNPWDRDAVLLRKAGREMREAAERLEAVARTAGDGLLVSKGSAQKSYGFQMGLTDHIYRCNPLSPEEKELRTAAVFALEGINRRFFGRLAELRGDKWFPPWPKGETYESMFLAQEFRRKRMEEG